MTTPKAIPLPPGLERDPIALQLQKMGRPVTRSAWLALDRGSDDETELDPEARAELDRLFPPEVETEEDAKIVQDRRRYRALQAKESPP